MDYDVIFSLNMSGELHSRYSTCGDGIPHGRGALPRCFTYCDM